MRFFNVALVAVFALLAGACDRKEGPPAPSYEEYATKYHEYKESKAEQNPITRPFHDTDEQERLQADMERIKQEDIRRQMEYEQSNNEQ